MAECLVEHKFEDLYEVIKGISMKKWEVLHCLGAVLGVVKNTALVFVFFIYLLNQVLG